MQILKFKKTDPKAIIPRRQTEGAAGFDLHALESEYLHKTTTPLMVRPGISVEIPPGHVGLIRDRSGLAAKYGMTVLAGVIDADYRGKVKVKLTCDDRPYDKPPLEINPGDRIAQAMVLPIPRVGFEEVADLSATARGQGGFGSTGE